MTAKSRVASPLQREAIIAIRQLRWKNNLALNIINCIFHMLRNFCIWYLLYFFNTSMQIRLIVQITNIALQGGLCICSYSTQHWSLIVCCVWCHLQFKCSAASRVSDMDYMDMEINCTLWLLNIALKLSYGAFRISQTICDQLINSSTILLCSKTSKYFSVLDQFNVKNCFEILSKLWVIWLWL